MYTISEDYLTALKYQVHQYKLSGNVAGTVFDEDDILSLSINNRCADSDVISIGSVYTAELNITFAKSLGIAWRNSKGWAISLEEGLWIDSLEEYQYVPLGTYYIEEVTTTKGNVEVKAYDAMTKFEKNTAGIHTSNQLLPDIVSAICNKCGVTLANESFSGFPNSNTTFTLDKENDIENCRDLLSWVAQTMASFATINRDGELELRMYKRIADYDDNIDADARADSYQFSEYITFYTGIMVTDREKQTSKYYSLEVDDGLTYNLGVNPFLQKMTVTRLQTCCMAILNAIENISYMPFSIECLPTAVYDLGDVIYFEDPSQVLTFRRGCIMLWDYTYNQKVKLEGMGKDPALANAKSKTDKNLSGILSQVKANKEYLYSFSNSEEKLLDANWQTVLKQRFGTVSATWALFHGEILCEALGDTVVEVRYLLDNEVVQRFPVETWKQGKHILSLMYPIMTSSENFYNWLVQMRSLSTSVDIPEGDAIGVIKGQGLVSSDVWNGYIDLDDTYELLEITEDIELLSYTDAANAGTLIPTAESISEDYDLLDVIDDSTVVHYLDVYAFNKDFHNKLTWNESAQMTWDQSEAFYIWGLDVEE